MNFIASKDALAVLPTGFRKSLLLCSSINSWISVKLHNAPDAGVMQILTIWSFSFPTDKILSLMFSAEICDFFDSHFEFSG